MNLHVVFCLSSLLLAGIPALRQPRFGQKTDTEIRRKTLPRRRSQTHSKPRQIKFFHVFQGSDSYIPVTSMPDNNDTSLLGASAGTTATPITVDATIVVQKPLTKGFHVHVLLMKQNMLNVKGGKTRHGYVYFTDTAHLPDGVTDIKSNDHRFGHVQNDPPYENDYTEDGTGGTTFDLQMTLTTPKQPVNYLIYLTVVDDNGVILDQGADPFTIT